jgi:murein DD-endopeptidase MepM/ murein hydrolase activator NlpD
VGGLALLVLTGAGVLLLFALAPQRLAEVGLLKFDTLPVDDARVSQGFREGEHSAIDFACPIGSALFNVAPGVVHRVHDSILGSSGRFVIVKGRQQFSTVAWSYSHLEQIDVREGQELGPGALIGLSGNSGLTCSDGVCEENRQGASGAHLHFAVLTNPGLAFLDPTPFLPFDEVNA